MVPPPRLELGHRRHQNLNLACLPIPPERRARYYSQESLSIKQLPLDSGDNSRHHQKYMLFSPAFNPCDLTI